MGKYDLALRCHEELAVEMAQELPLVCRVERGLRDRLARGQASSNPVASLDSSRCPGVVEDELRFHGSG